MTNLETKQMYGDRDVFWPYGVTVSFCFCSVTVPFGQSLLQLSQQVLVEFVELWEVIQDLVENSLLNHGLPILTRGFGHHISEVLFM